MTNKENFLGQMRGFTDFTSGADFCQAYMRGLISGTIKSAGCGLITHEAATSHTLEIMADYEAARAEVFAERFRQTEMKHA